MPSNVQWHPGRVTREDRVRSLGARGATIWLTGLSGSGKSTVAAALEHRLVMQGRNAYRLDGDNLRTGLNEDLGFSREGRQENVRRAAEVACLLADAGLVALVALISPYADARLSARRLHERAGLPFVEVYMAAPADLCSTAIRRASMPRRRPGRSARSPGLTTPTSLPSHPSWSSSRAPRWTVRSTRCWPCSTRWRADRLDDGWADRVTRSSGPVRSRWVQRPGATQAPLTTESSRSRPCGIGSATSVPGGIIVGVAGGFGPLATATAGQGA